jgi:sporulation protein YlmC with PRC-barrel domain
MRNEELTIISNEIADIKVINPNKFKLKAPETETIIRPNLLIKINNIEINYNKVKKIEILGNDFEHTKDDFGIYSISFFPL